MSLTEADAERVWTHEYADNPWLDYGTVDIRGVKYWWWASQTLVYFYDEAEKSGTDTCARFVVHHSFVPEPHNA